MKKQLFNQEGTIELIEGTSTLVFHDNLPDRKEHDIPKIETKIYTDGEIVEVSEPVIEPITEYYIGKERYTNNLSKKKTRTIQLKNHTYAVVYTLAEEYLTIGNIRGFFKVVKEVKVYVHSKKDLKAIKQARKTMNMIAEGNRSVDYSSLLTMLASPRAPRTMEYEEQVDNVYILKK